MTEVASNEFQTQNQFNVDIEKPSQILTNQQQKQQPQHITQSKQEQALKTDNLSVEVQLPVSLGQKQQQIASDKYGPFDNKQSSDENNFELKPVHENLSYEIDVSPILNTTRERNFRGKKSKKSSSILTEQSITDIVMTKKEQGQIQKEILQLAKNIRRKVHKKQHSLNNDSNLIHSFIEKQRLNSSQIPSPQSKKPKKKQIDMRLKQIHKKRMSLFQKYSYPHSSTTLQQLQKNELSLNLNKKYKVPLVHNEQLLEQSTIQYNNSSRESQVLEGMNSQAQNKTKRSTSKTHSLKSRKEKESELLPKIKLNFDKKHYKYEMTEFRKSIIKEKKDKELEKSLVIKQKQSTLNKRRQLFNNSRYNPIGVKLNPLRQSKLHQLKNQATIQLSPVKHLSERNNIDTGNEIQTVQHLESESHKNIETSQQLMNSNNISNSQSMKTPTWQQSHPHNLLPNNTEHFNNPSTQTGKSSLTFNFSFGDQPPHVHNLTKSQAQIFNEVSNLTKLLENDSTPEQKLKKINQKEQQDQKAFIELKDRKKQKQVKKWTKPENKDKEMTESKNFQQKDEAQHFKEVGRLHNSSFDENESQDEYHKAQLQYSYV